MNKKEFPVKKNCYYLGSVRVNFPKLPYSEVSKTFFNLLLQNVGGGAIAPASPMAAPCLTNIVLLPFSMLQ